VRVTHVYCTSTIKNRWFWKGLRLQYESFGSTALWGGDEEQPSVRPSICLFLCLYLSSFWACYWRDDPTMGTVDGRYNQRIFEVMKTPFPQIQSWGGILETLPGYDINQRIIRGPVSGQLCIWGKGGEAQIIFYFLSFDYIVHLLSRPLKVNEKCADKSPCPV